MTAMISETLSVQCCIAGEAGRDDVGPVVGSGWRLGGLLEKHADFSRDFRGDTLHPSTLEIMHELGMLELFPQLPNQKVTRINARFGDLEFPVADFALLSTQCHYVAFMPQSARPTCGSEQVE